MEKIYIGIDNGVSGSIGILKDNKDEYFLTPIKNKLDYTKTKKFINRIDGNKLKEMLISALGYENGDGELSDINKNCLVAIERPMVNPGRFVATGSALRSLEATLIVIEDLDLPYMYIDSKEWQKEVLPSGLKGEELKRASLEVGNRLFPEFREIKHPDRDGLLIAEYLKRKKL